MTREERSHSQSSEIHQKWKQNETFSSWEVACGRTALLAEMFSVFRHWFVRAFGDVSLPLSSSHSSTTRPSRYGILCLAIASRSLSKFPLKNKQIQQVTIWKVKGQWGLAGLSTFWGLEVCFKHELSRFMSHFSALFWTNTQH